MPERNVSALTSLLACLFYGFVSTSITFFNKAVLASYEFKSPNIMTLFQVLFSLVFLVTMKQCRLIQYPSITWQTSIKVTATTATRTTDQASDRGTAPELVES